MSIKSSQKSIVASSQNTTNNKEINMNAKIAKTFEAAIAAAQAVHITYTDFGGTESVRTFLPLTAINAMKGGDGNHMVWGKSSDVAYVGEPPVTECPEYHSIVLERVSSAKIAKVNGLNDGMYWVPFAMRLHFGSRQEEYGKVVRAFRTFTKFFVIKGVTVEKEIERKLDPRQDARLCATMQQQGMRLLNVEAGKGQWLVAAQQGTTQVFAPVQVETSVVYANAADRRAERQIF